MQLTNMRVLIMGLGVHGGGVGVARWLLRRGASVTITDLASADKLAASLDALAQTERECKTAIRYVLGEHRQADFTSHDMLVVNPAVRPDSPWLLLARDAGVRIETEMTLFFRHCPGPILGITGTKGKTTTTLLAGAMLRHPYPDTVVAGNLRISALDALERVTPTTPVVLELSSFQLVALGEARLSPAYACVTNLSPDHLNYHGTMADYAEAKQQIFLHQDERGVLVLNQELMQEWRAALASAAGRHYSFSTASDSGADCSITAEGDIMFAGERILQRDDIQLPGPHNQANVLAAVALARSFGVSPAHICAAVQQFGGAEHRLELVRTLDGVRYVNDTTATNPAAAQAALASFEAPIVLLAGGADKALPVEGFARDIAHKVKALVLLEGSATPRLYEAVQAANTAAAPITAGPYANFGEAIRVARRLAAPGDVVLLSPGCASFGMFENEFHRGDEFRRIVANEL
jgi:UDP-N-acetylmuramoylalanine--D-glutamate ligase